VGRSRQIFEILSEIQLKQKKTEMVELLPSKYKLLISDPSTIKKKKEINM
jgi:hypothetical protein